MLLLLLLTFSLAILSFVSVGSRVVCSVLLTFVAAALPGQGLPRHPKSNKCYLKMVTLDVYDFWQDSVLTYSDEDAQRYPHELVEIITKPAFGRWELTTMNDCASADPADCQVLCYRTYPAEVFTYFKPIDNALGQPFYYMVAGRRLVEKGGLTAYEEIDCKWNEVNELPLSFSAENHGLDDQDKQLITEKLLYLFHAYPGIRLSLSVYVNTFGSSGAESQALAEELGEIIRDYLKAEGVGEEQLIISGFGESSASDTTIAAAKEGVRSPSIRVVFKALLIEQYVKPSRSRDRRKKGKRRKNELQGRGIP